MAYQIIRVAGYKNAAAGSKGFGGIQIHDQRVKGVSHTNDDIDWERSHLNYDLHNHGEKISFAEKINERIASLDMKKSPRKDANIMAQIFISASPEFFENVSEWTQQSYFESAYEWIGERYGFENIISATVHMDEATPHMHINLVPITKEGKLCYADLFTEKPQVSRGRNGGQLTALQDDFQEHNQASGYRLQRGEPQSVAGKKKHLSVLDYKKQERAKEVEGLETLKEQTMQGVTELRSTALEVQGDINSLEAEIKRLEGLRSDIQGQIKTAQDELGKLGGKILTKQGIDKISENKKVSRGLFGKEDMVTLPDADYESLVKTALASPRVETTTENKKLKAENKSLKVEAGKVNSLGNELFNVRKKLEGKDDEINALNERLGVAERTKDSWVTKAQVAEHNYKRVLGELNELKGRNKNRGLDRN